MRGKPLSDETRAAVVAALLTGQAVNVIAREHGLNASTVSTIKKSLPQKQFELVRTESRSRLDDLLIDALATNLSAQAFLLDAVCDRNYVSKQSAEHISTLYGTIADKALRIIEITNAAAHQDRD